MKIGYDYAPDYAKFGIIVIVVYYRLSPEHVHPAATEDSYSALKWIAENYKTHKLLKSADINKIAVIGDSAGGYLAAKMPHLVRDRNLDIKISLQILIYPVLTQEVLESERRLSKGYMLSSKSRECINMNHFGSREVMAENEPIGYRNFKDIPKAMFVVGLYDMLYSQSEKYERLLRENSIETEFREYKSVHGFYNVMRTGNEDYEAFWDIVKFLAKNGFIDM